MQISERNLVQPYEAWNKRFYYQIVFLLNIDQFDVFASVLNHCTMYL